MRRGRRPGPRQANLFGRVRARLERASDQSTGSQVFTARSSPRPEGTQVPDPVVPADAPGVRIHSSRLDGSNERPRLTPSQALELAKDGPKSLRRDRPRAG